VAHDLKGERKMSEATDAIERLSEEYSK